MKKILKSFDIEFQPFIEEINVKEGVIQKFADAATMNRVRGKYGSTYRGDNKAKSNACTQVLRVLSRRLHQSYYQQ